MVDPETRGGVIVLAGIVLGIVAALMVTKHLPNGRAETPGQSALCIGAFVVVVVGFCAIALSPIRTAELMTEASRWPES